MKLVNINKSFGDKKVLENINLDIEQGKSYVISGVSGRGKTTLLRIMMGLEKADSGQITDMPEKISAVFQEDRLHNDFTPYVCVKMICDRTVPKSEIYFHLEQVGLSDYADKPVSTLSGGMRRRVAIVRAVIHDADIIYMDEPYTGLDRETKLKVIEYIKRYTKGKTLVCVSHDAEDARLLNAKSIEY